MAKQYDNTAKELIEFGPADWVSFIGAPGAAERVSLIDSNLSTITSEADKVIRVNDPEPWLLHLELQASCEPDMARRLLRCTSLLHYRHELPVVSALILLRKEANSPELTGHYAMSGPFGTNLTFRYLVFKVWEEPPKRFLSGGLALLPFAPISRVTESDLPRVVDHLQNRVMQEADTKQRGQIWTATSILLG
jgi:predicted transposase YdaD